MAFDQLLQAEAGFTRTEPTQLAVRQAIDLAVYATIMQGVQRRFGISPTLNGAVSSLTNFWHAKPPLRFRYNDASKKTRRPG